MNYWQSKVTIGPYSFPRFIGGPLDGITDSPFRQLVRDFSKDELLYTEMRHVACIANDKGGQRALKFLQTERPINYQIAANEPRFVVEACEKIMAAGVDIIDLNVGCPAPAVTANKSGSALMDDLPRLKSILTTMESCLKIPFTVKIRAGFTCKNAVDVAKLIQDCGAAAVAIHPRTRAQKFNGRPDYELAAQVKQAVQIPVLLSGNVVNYKTAQLAYNQTGVDGFLIGRGIWGKPWQLREMQEHAEGNPYKIDQVTMLYYALQHLHKMLEHYGPKGLYCFRKHMPFYLRGFENASSVRQQLVIANSVDEVTELLSKLQEVGGAQ
ncbi:MAG: tRNA dihydrouridine synthase [Candidatus Babeliales bacterium]